jgi:Protein of unknown function (DUF3098)
MATQKKIVPNVESPQPTKSRISDTPSEMKVSSELVFGKRNFYFIIGGALLILIGMFLMAGGNMPSPDVWDDNIIYSTRRTVIAPIFILAGLSLQIVAIFTKKN